MAALASLHTRCLAPARHSRAAFAPKASAKPVLRTSLHASAAKLPAGLGPQIQPAGLNAGLRSSAVQRSSVLAAPQQRKPLHVCEAAAGGAAAPAKFKWGAFRANSTFPPKPPPLEHATTMMVTRQIV